MVENVGSEIDRILQSLRNLTSELKITENNMKGLESIMRNFVSSFSSLRNQENSIKQLDSTFVALGNSLVASTRNADQLNESLLRLKSIRQGILDLARQEATAGRNSPQIQQQRQSIPLHNVLDEPSVSMPSSGIEQVRRTWEGLGTFLEREGLTSQQAINKVQNAFQEFGFSTQDTERGLSTLKSVYTDQATGLSKLSASFTDAEGNIKNLNISIDKFGNIDPGELSKTWEGFGKTLSSSMMSSGEAATRLQQAVENAGFSLGDIQNVTKDANSGLAQIQLRSEEAEGGVKKMTITMDEAGKVSEQVSNSFKTLAQQLKKNFTEFARLTLVLSVIYGAIRQFSESVELAIKNETELASIAVILGNNQEQLERAFEASAQAAHQAAESIDGVLEGYAQALKATGGITNETERLAAANELLSASLVLSKLSSFDQASAMDTLVAALRQAEVGLDQGTELLDKWVATTKVANVDLRTLAESYAIAGITAKNAGIEIGGANDELVGLIAVLAEQTQLTPTETGNALRAVISGITTDVAERELRKFGVAIRDTQGNLLEFMDIANRVASLMNQGVIDDAQLGKIARAIGGGVRRQGQVEIVLRNLAKAQQINAATVDSSGSAYEALQLKVDTFESSITRLSNAFQELTHTIGTSGGMLDTASMLVDIFSALVRLTDGLVSGLGKSTSSLALLGGLFAVGKLTNQTPFGGFGTGLQGGLVGAGNPLTERGGLTRGGFGATALSATSLLLPALQNMSEGNDKAAIADAVGGSIGAAIGAILGGNLGMVVGTNIGVAVGESFVSTVLEMRGDIFKSIAFTPGEPQEEKEKEGKTDRQILEEQISQQTAQKTGEVLLGLLGIDASEKTDVTVGNLTSNVASGVAKFWETVGFDMSDFRNAQGGLEATDFSTGVVRAQDPQLFEEFKDAIKGLESTLPATQRETEFEFDKRLGTINEQIRPIFDSIKRGMQEELQQGIISGDITGKEFATQFDVMAGLPSLISTVLAAQTSGTPSGQGFGGIQLGEEFLNVTETVQLFSEVLSGATDEQRDYINSLSFEAQLLDQQLEAFNQGLIDTITTTEGLELSADEAAKAIDGMNAATLDYIESLRIQQVYNEFKENQAGSFQVGGDLPLSQVAGLINQYLPEYLSAYEENVLLGDKDVIAGAKEDIYQQSLLQRGGLEYQSLTAEAPAEVIRSILKMLQDTGQLGGDSQFQNPGFLELPFGRDKMPQFLQEYDKFLMELEKLGYQEDPSDTIALFSNKEMELMHKDNTIIQFLLGQIEDNTQEMVDGIYNLPSDGTFFVPFTGYQAGYANRSPGSGGGLDNLDELIKKYIAVNGLTPNEEGKLISPTTSQPTNMVSKEPVGSAMSKRMIDPTVGLMDTLTMGGGATATQKLSPTSTTNPDWGLFHKLKMFNEQPMKPTQASEILSGTQPKMTSEKLTIEIDATFNTHIDGERVATVTRKFVEDNLERKQGVNGIQLQML